MDIEKDWNLGWNKTLNQLIKNKIDDKGLDF